MSLAGARDLGLSVDQRVAKMEKKVWKRLPRAHKGDYGG